jgi:hypothetical protein
MHKNRALWLSVIILVLLVLVGVKTYLTPRDSTYVASNDKVTLENDKTSANSQTQSTVKTSSETQAKKASPAVSVDPQEKCVAQTNQDLKNKGATYQKGSLLVTFDKTVSWQQGKVILADYNASYSASTEAQGGFTTKSWVEISVPSGQEIAILCMLEDNPNITYVGVNQIFKLHE